MIRIVNFVEQDAFGGIISIIKKDCLHYDT